MKLSLQIAALAVLAPSAYLLLLREPLLALLVVAATATVAVLAALDCRK